jgi:NAD-dependent DNA ligase
MELTISEQNLINSLTGQYLIHSYLYYRLYQSIIPDDLFDKICVLLERYYDSIQHQHKHLISPESLRAGTGFNLGYNDYPLVVQSIADQIMSNKEFREMAGKENKKYELLVNKLLDKG